MARRSPYDRTWSMRIYRFGLQKKEKIQNTLERSVEGFEDLLEPGIQGVEEIGSALEDQKVYLTNEDLEGQNTLDNLEKEEKYDR